MKITATTGTVEKITNYQVNYVIDQSNIIGQSNRKTSFTKAFNKRDEAIEFIDELLDANDNDNPSVYKITLQETIKQDLERWERFEEFDGELMETLTREVA